jgi:group I intron endonuclease
MFRNNKTKNRFIGMSSNLLPRLLSYSSKSWLENKRNSIIQKAIHRHGLHKFSVYILEYCETSELRSKKQYYIDVLKPQYNIRKSICLSWPRPGSASSHDKTPTTKMISETVSKKKNKNKNKKVLTLVTQHKK